MKAAAFAYVRPTTVAGVLAHLDGGRDVKILAGGQSLMPSLHLRLSAPELIVDINRVDALRGIDLRDGQLRIGALARHADVAGSALVATHLPLIARAMHYVAHPAIRNRGTTCGSLANADPAAEMPACAVALDATLVLLSRQGRRTVSARDYFLGIFETARQDNELLAEVLFPLARASERFGFDEVATRHGDFAAAGVAARASVTGDRIDTLDLVLFASEARPLLSVAAAETAAGQTWSPALAEAIATAVSVEMEPIDNLNGRGDTKRKQARTLIARVLKGMLHE